MHFMVFDHRARESFLNGTLRLFLERTVESEAPHTRAVALFGFYTFYFTQPSGAAPALHRIAHIPIPLDQYASLKALPSSLIGNYLLPLQPVVFHILSTLVTDGVFFLVPSTHLHALNPRDLPREVFVDEETVMLVDPAAPKKKGRPTRLDKAKKVKASLHNLERRLEDPSCQISTAAIPLGLACPSEANDTVKTQVEATLVQYLNSKSQLLSRIDLRAQSGGPSERYTFFQQANQFVLDRLKATEELLASDGVSLNDPNAVLARVERAVKEFIEAEEDGQGQGGGLLSLLEGAA